MKYFLKVKGTSKIPDYLQIRDESFCLIVHCQLKAFKKNLEKHHIQLNEEQIDYFLNEVPFGQLTPLEEK